MEFRTKAVKTGNGTIASTPTKMLTSTPVRDSAEQLNEETRDKYVKGKRIGEGTYATVFEAHMKSDATKKVAIKKIKVNEEFKDGLSMDAIREMKHLQELSHPNIIALLDVFSSKNQNINLVLEFLPNGNLEEIIRATDPKNAVNYGMADVKAWMGMICRGIYWCHGNYVLHRDIKPNNIFIAADGTLKVADFGLSRKFPETPYDNMTHSVITRWYRPPELFYRARHYSGAVDIWSVGMVFAELIKRGPFLPGNTDLEQINYICAYIGTPTEKNWPDVSKLEGYVPYDKIHAPRPRHVWDQEFGGAGKDGVSLMMAMLSLDPRKRPTAKDVLEHEYWTNEPRPSKLEDLPKKGGGVQKMGENLKRKGGEVVEDGRGDKVARKLDFYAMKG